MRTTSIPVRPNGTERLGKFQVFRQGSNKGYEIACIECQPTRETHGRLVTTFKRTWPLATEYMDAHKETHQEDTVKSMDPRIQPLSDKDRIKMFPSRYKVQWGDEPQQYSYARSESEAHNVLDQAAQTTMTTEEYEEEHCKIGLEHEAKINYALLSYGDNREHKVERADRWLENAVNQLDKRYIGF